MNREFAYILIAIVIGGCAGMRLPRVSADQATWAASHWPEMDTQRLVAARTLYVRRCSACHNLVLPEKRSAEQWDVMLSSMAPRAKINEDQKEQIRRYILTVKSVPN